MVLLGAVEGISKEGEEPLPLIVSNSRVRSSRLFVAVGSPYHRRPMAKRAGPPRRDSRDTSDRQHPKPQPTALARLLDAPHLAHVVARLTPDVLHHLIRHHGLEACGALVAAATPQQVAAILDLDLWQPAAAGGDDQCDPSRVGGWRGPRRGEGQ